MKSTASDIILERMMSLHPKVIDLTLDRVWRLLDALGNPQEKLPPVIHIAGTNGKGSTLSMIRAGLEGVGKKVHAYTSPHLVRFHERIYLAGASIDEGYLSEILDECYRANDGAPITYFEITTCAAILAFSRVKADYILLEVGLGGRLDATNVITKPALSVITPVSIDHQSFLGDTLTEIAGEKAGILKRNCSAVIAKQQDEAQDVIEAYARKVGTTLISYGQEWHIGSEHGRLIFQDEAGLLDLPKPVLRGAHQIENAGTAIASLRQLGFGEKAAVAALSEAKWPARMQLLRSGELTNIAPEAEIWLDGGHNAEAGKALSETVKEMLDRPLFLIVGMINTKDISAYLAPLCPLAKKTFSLTIPNESAAVDARDIADVAKQHGCAAECVENVDEAVKQVSATHPNARILICGSLYLAGHVLTNNA